MTSKLWWIARMLKYSRMYMLGMRGSTSLRLEVNSTCKVRIFHSSIWLPNLFRVILYGASILNYFHHRWNISANKLPMQYLSALSATVNLTQQNSYRSNSWRRKLRSTKNCGENAQLCVSSKRGQRYLSKATNINVLFPICIIEFRPWEWLKYCLNKRSIIMIFRSLVYVYICPFNISRTKTGAPLHVFLRSLFSTFILVYFWCLAPSLCFQTPLFSHKNESSSLCTCMHTITQLCGGASKYQNICDESIKLVQLPFGNHPDTKQFLVFNISCTQHYFSIEKKN